MSSRLDRRGLQRLARITLGMGVAASLLGSLMLAGRRATTVEPGLVVECRSTHSHGPKLAIVLDTGQHLWLGWEEVEHPQRCFAGPMRIEKRAGTYDYLFNGYAYEWPNRATFQNFLVVGAGLVLVAIALGLVSRRSR